MARNFFLISWWIVIFNFRYLIIIKPFWLTFVFNEIKYYWRSSKFLWLRSELASDSKDKKEYFSVLSHKIDIINTPPTPFTDNLPLHDMHNGVKNDFEELFWFLIGFSLKIVLRFHYIRIMWRKNTTWQFLSFMVHSLPLTK